MNKDEFNFLNKIQSPDDLKKFNDNDLIEISKELRQFIINEVSLNPGHFGASLGVVELTVALHYVFDTPNDLLVWDVGHQAYAHKILTGRKGNFHTNRKYKGISGFPNRSESVYDAFGVGHSSTSISAALGMAVASKKQATKKQVVAIIGDASIASGMAFEGLNNVAANNTDMLVILNDNNMAIDPNTGALKEYLLDIATSKTYNRVKNDVWKFLEKLNKVTPKGTSTIQKIDNAIKSIVLRHSNLFESLNFRYFGPVDGHDVNYLAKVLDDLKDIPGPKLLHCITKKGKGFKLAEENQTTWHAPGLFNRNTGEILKLNTKTTQSIKYQEVFGRTIIELAEKNNKIVGITPAMLSGCSLNLMQKEMPDRVFDVGIAEQHAVTFSAGLATQGMIPFCNIYSTFMQRAIDQVIHDVALQKLNVVFCLDRAGIVGEDGATHHGVFDISYMRMIPNMIVASPMDEQELRNIMYTAQTKNMGPISIRYPRGNGTMEEWQTPFEEIEIGKARMIKDGKDIAILSIGNTGNFVVKATTKLKLENIDIAHFDMRFIKPLDTDILDFVFKNYTQVITIEDSVLTGGFGSAIIEYMVDNAYQNTKITRLGIPDRFIEHGTVSELHEECKYDSDAIYTTVKSIFESTKHLVKRDLKLIPEE